MKIRCTDCEKKISIDDAFAGGICRCPYCKALVPVPGEMNTATHHDRPAAPGGRSESPPRRPEAPAPRPETPQASEGTGVRPAMAAAAPTIDEDQIPMAQPVRLQGALVVVLLAVMLAVVGGVAGIVIYEVTRDDPLNGNGPVETPASENPFVVNTKTPAVGGNIEINPPVAYVIDGGTSMREFYPDAARIVLASVRSLQGGSFTIIICGEKSDTALAGGLAAADDARVTASEKLLAQRPPGGATPLNRAVQAAMDAGAATVVLVLRKEADSVMPLAEAIKTKPVGLVVLGIGPSTGEQKSQAEFAAAAGGTAKAWSRSDLGTLTHQADELLPTQ